MPGGMMLWETEEERRRENKIGTIASTCLVGVFVGLLIHAYYFKNIPSMKNRAREFKKLSYELITTDSTNRETIAENLFDKYSDYRSCYGKEISLSIKLFPYLENSYQRHINNKNKNPKSPSFYSENFSHEDLEKTIQRCDSIYKDPGYFHSFWDMFR
jgi:hypothetical protein